jgi:DUF971 family protein
MRQHDETWASREGLSPDAATPIDLKINLTEQSLFVRWKDGSESHYPMGYLRRHCPCATCKTEREKEQPLLPILKTDRSGAIRVLDAGLVGNYAVQLVWSDGHNTGIYDFRYLRAIAPDAGSDG